MGSGNGSAASPGMGEGGGVALSPVHMGINIAPVQAGDGRGMVLLSVTTAQGTSVFFFTPETAEQIVGKMSQAATLARTGLIVPPTTLN